MYYVRFETMITNPCLERWANTWIGWQTNLVWSSTHPEQYLKIRLLKKKIERLIIDHLKSRRKSNDWISKILKVKKYYTSISIQQWQNQRYSISCLCIPAWSFDHLNTSSQERSWLIAQNLKVWSWSNKNLRYHPAIRRISTARQSIQLTWCHN